MLNVKVKGERKKKTNIGTQNPPEIRIITMHIDNDPHTVY